MEAMEGLDEIHRLLLEQKSADLQCPDCHSSITHKVILRKKDIEECAPAAVVAGNVSIEVDPDDFMHAVLHQETHELVCPECHYCMTHEVILQKRKREDREPHGQSKTILDELMIRYDRDLESDLLQKLQKLLEQHQQPQAERRHVVIEIEEEKEDDFPPVKKLRTLTAGAEVKKQRLLQTEEKEEEEDEDEDDDEDFDLDLENLKRILQSQTSHDMTCLECESKITSYLILQRRRRRSLRTSRWIEDDGRKSVLRIIRDNEEDPWRTRYDIFYEFRPPRSVEEVIQAQQGQPGRARFAARISNLSPLTEPLLGDQDATISTYQIGGRLFEPHMYEYPPGWLAYFTALTVLWIIWLATRIF